jgi:hypothetical protein
MAALSLAQENALSLWLVVFLAVLLALSLAAVITSPGRSDSPPAEGAGAGPDLPGPAPGPPWGPAPKPGAPVQYGGQVIDTSTGRTWRCPHNHPTPESASRCADFMQEQIRRLGWDKATGERL